MIRHGTQHDRTCETREERRLETPNDTLHVRQTYLVFYRETNQHSPSEFTCFHAGEDLSAQNKLIAIVVPVVISCLETN